MGKRDFQKEHTTDILKEMVIARLEKGGETFEILIDSNCVDEIRSNPEASVLIILVANCQSQEMSFFNMNTDTSPFDGLHAGGVVSSVEGYAIHQSKR